MLLSLNGTHTINPKFYTFAGLNIPTTLSEFKVKLGGQTITTVKYKSRLGFQVGTGYKINKKIAIELTYVAINAKKSTDLNEELIRIGDSTKVAQTITLNTKYTF